MRNSFRVVVALLGAIFCEALPVIDGSAYVACDGVTNDTAGMTAAFTAAGLGPARTVILPAGTCIVNSGVISGPKNLRLIGQGQFGTTLSTPDATGDVLTIDGGSTVSDLGFTATVTRTAGAFLRPKRIASPMPIVVTRVAMEKGYQDVNYDSSIVELTINDSTCSAETSDDIAAGSGCIVVSGGGIIHINNLLHGPASPPNRARCVVCVTAGNVTIVGGQYIHGKHAILINPGSGETVWLSAKGAWLDSCVQQCVAVRPTGTGVVAFVDIQSPWIGPLSGNAIEVTQIGNTSVTVFNLAASILTNYTPNSGSGVYVSGIIGGAAKVSANVISNFSWGVGFAPGTSNFHVDANSFANLGGPAVVVQGGPSNNYSITNNLSLGSSGGIADGGAGSNKLVVNNH